MDYKIRVCLAGVVAAMFLITGMSGIFASKANADDNPSGPLPNYLAGTIFDSNASIVVTADGSPPDDPVEFDCVLSYQEADRIRLEARERYMERYGVDPWQPDDAGPPANMSEEEKQALFKRGLDYPGDPDELLDSYRRNNEAKKSEENLPLFSGSLSPVYASENYSVSNQSLDAGNEIESIDLGEATSLKQRHHPVLGGANPRADFTISDITPDVGEIVYFDASASECDAWIDCYAWDFNHNTADDDWGKTVSHSYSSPGLYTVKLWVRNGYNHDNVDSIHVDILVGGASGDIEPIADFTVSNDNPQTGETITFDASDAINTESIVCYAWDFNYNTGDDRWGETVTKSYSNRGLYTVKLWVQEQGDTSDSDRILMDIPVRGDHDEAVNEIDGRVKPKVFFACDSEHEPDPSEWISEVKSVMARFRGEFDIWPWKVSYYYNVWDASGTGDDSSEQLRDLDNLEGTYADDDYEFLIGIVQESEHNGIAWSPGQSCVCVDEATAPIEGWDWPHDSIIQHEVSHLCSASEGGTWPWENGWKECVMNYYDAWSGENGWCDDHENEIMNGLWGAN